MTHLHAFVAVGTAAALLGTLLLLLRAEFHGRRPVLALTRRWVATDGHTSGFVLALFTAVALSCFAGLSGNEASRSNGASTRIALAYAPSLSGIGSDDSPRNAQAFEALRAYADEIDAKGQPTAAAASPPPGSVELPAVDTMLAKLVARLEKQPDDVRGWKMLAWSYLNTERADEAAKAYQTALNIDPDDLEIKKGLDAAKAAQTATAATPSADPAALPTAQDMEAARNRSGAEGDAMIRGMVDRLAARLENSPNDEDGWTRLMRSRMTLGEKEAAKAALRKALQTFAGDAAAKSRLNSAARDIGVEGD